MRAEPFHCTVEPLTKLAPLTDRLKAAPPALAEAGLNPVVIGTGLLIVKVWALEVPPPGAAVKTVRLAVPAAAMSAVGIQALNCALLT